jgi:hypothetical protein
MTQTENFVLAAQDSKLIVSNDNLTASGSPDSAITTKE